MLCITAVIRPSLTKYSDSLAHITSFVWGSAHITSCGDHGEQSNDLTLDAQLALVHMLPLQTSGLEGGHAHDHTHIVMWSRRTTRTTKRTGETCSPIKVKRGCDHPHLDHPHLDPDRESNDFQLGIGKGHNSSLRLSMGSPNLMPSSPHFVLANLQVTFLNSDQHESLLVSTTKDNTHTALPGHVSSQYRPSINPGTLVKV